MVSIRILAKGRCNEILAEGKWYNPPGSKGYGKLEDPGIIICTLIRGM